jgi:hypothetical protein
MCPSAQPGMADVRILGVISREGEAPRLDYVTEVVEATQEILEAAKPVAVSQIFRLAARCEESKCTHFDGARCQLAVRITKLLPEVDQTLPTCVIRPECRWFRQEGRSACLRCPQIMTGNSEVDDRLREIAGPAALQRANPVTR